LGRRVLYVPSTGVCLLWGYAVSGGTSLSAPLSRRRAKQATAPLPPRSKSIFANLAIAAAAAMVCAYAARTVLRNRDWRDVLSLWESVLVEFPDSGHAHGQLAKTLRAAGRTEDAERHYLKAIELRGKAIEILNLASMYANLGPARWDEAISYYEIMEKQEPGLGVFISWGGIHDRRQEYTEAVRVYLMCAADVRKSRLTLYQDDSPWKFECSLRAATGLLRHGMHEEALEALRRAVEISPQMWEAWRHDGTPTKRTRALTLCTTDARHVELERLRANFMRDYGHDRLVRQLQAEGIIPLLFCQWYVPQWIGKGWFQLSELKV
jgi:tetratricopeptide (TPR) repeat protein